MRAAACVALFCVGCVYDYGALSGHGGTGGRSAQGTGGVFGTGGGSSGGQLGTGGREAGDNGTGGSATGGNVAETGGRGTGGTSTGGTSTGGASTGGTSTGGASTGGTSAGGSGTGGTNTGGVGSGGGVGGVGGATPDPDLVLWYKFDEATGTIAADSSQAGGGPRNGTLATAGTGGAVTFSTLHQVGTHSVSLTANASTGGGYVVLPPLVALAPAAVTLSAWVYSTSDRDWQRLFDFGTGTTINAFLTTSEGADANNYVRFAITLGGSAAEQRINTTTVLTQNAWHHLVVVLAGGAPYTGTVYIDGVASGTNAAMTLHAADMGTTSNNFIGKSQFSADAYLAGQVDDFRIYKRALTAAEVTTLFGQRE